MCFFTPPPVQHDPALEDWANDDLLIEEPARKGLSAVHPKVAELLDWPELRDHFVRHNKPAGQEKTTVRRSGRRAVGFAFAAFSFTALSGLAVGATGSLLASYWSWVTGALTVFFTGACFFTGVMQMLHGGRKWAWMVERLWTETLRRFFFQFLLQNLEAARGVLTGTLPLSAWRDLQAKALSTLINEEMHRPTDVLRDVLNDHAETKCWSLAGWKSPVDLPSVGPCKELDEFFEVLAHKRLTIQKDYTTRKLAGSRLALRGRTHLIQALFYALVFFILLVDASIGILHLLEPSLAMPNLLAGFGLVTALASAALVAVQMWDRGERVSAETDRMEWYLAAVESILRRYEHIKTVDERIRALAELEILAYQEMRQFLLSVHRGEFVAG